MLTDTSVSNISKYPDRDKSHQTLTYRHCYSTQMLLYILIKMEIKFLESKTFHIAGPHETSWGSLVIPNENKSEFSCKVCGHVSKDKSNCRRHVKTKHFFEVVGVCCLYLSLAGQHSYYIYGTKLCEQTPIICQDPQACSICNAVLKNKVCLKQHMKNVHAVVLNQGLLWN